MTAAVQKSWKTSWKGSELVLQTFLLVAIFVTAFCLRLFAVIRFESVIHEFDPWFNFRVTQYLTQEGTLNFHNWFDNKTWYPLGRFIGGTVYPGLMWTAALMHYLANNLLNITINIRDTCVFTAPLFAGNTAVVCYLFTKECWNSTAGIWSAFFISMVPGYVSRSVAGSYDNEAVAIFALTLTFYLWVRSVRTGSLLSAGLCSLAYAYMVAAWGGYIFITNLIPLHVFFLTLCGRYSHRLYIAYCSWYVIGILMSMQIQFVSFTPVSSPEHLASFGIFCLLQLFCFVNYLRNLVKTKKDKDMLTCLVVMLFLSLLIVVVLLMVLGFVPGLTMRFLALLGSQGTIAIVKSVSEHQPTSWGTYFFDCNVLTFFALAGIITCFKKPTDANLFAILYGVTSSYFSNIMIRLMLVVSPAICVLSAIAISEFVASASETLWREPTAKPYKHLYPHSGPTKVETSRNVFNKLIGAVILIGMGTFCFLYATHCTFVTSIAYSSPSIVLQARGGRGAPTIFDDFREAYQWLYHNTDENAKVLSWWDYGYQMTGMGNKTVIVDNNTRNNTHIATVGLTMASNEDKAYPILQRLDVQYILVVFGGLIGYSSDDINKFLWMVRISGGVFPRIVERNYFSQLGGYSMGMDVSQTMRESLMYKMCYYRFEQVAQDGFDRTRNTKIGHQGFQLKYIEEAYTTEHWMVRIYRVKDRDQVSKYK